MKKTMLVIVIVLAVALTMLTSFAESMLSTEVSSDNINQGDTFTFVVAVEPTAFKSASAAYAVSEGLTVVSGEWIPEDLMSDVDLDLERAVFAFDESKNYSGDLFKLTVKVNDDATEEQTITVRIQQKDGATEVLDETVERRVALSSGGNPQTGDDTGIVRTAAAVGICCATVILVTLLADALKRKNRT